MEPLGPPPSTAVLLDIPPMPLGQWASAGKQATRAKTAARPNTTKTCRNVFLVYITRTSIRGVKESEFWTVHTQGQRLSQPDARAGVQVSSGPFATFGYPAAATILRQRKEKRENTAAGSRRDDRFWRATYLCGKCRRTIGKGWQPPGPATPSRRPTRRGDMASRASPCTTGSMPTLREGMPPGPSFHKHRGEHAHAPRGHATRTRLSWTP
jgi:hypothetical protein